jgi:hypothetical protein
MHRSKYKLQDNHRKNMFHLSPSPSQGNEPRQRRYTQEGSRHRVQFVIVGPAHYWTLRQADDDWDGINGSNCGNVVE